MVTDQILARNSQVHGVPVLELVAHLHQLLLGHGAALLGVSTLAEHEVPALGSQVFGLDTEGSNLRAVDAVSMEQAGNGVVGHVDGGVGQRLDDVLSVPGEGSAETLGSGAAPLLEPVDDQVELVLSLGVESVEVVRVEVLANELLPLIFSVLQEPLVAACNQALVTGSGDNLTFGLVVRAGKVLFVEVLLNLRLGVLNALASGNSDEELALIESLEVNLILGDLEQVLIFLRLDLEVVNELNSRHVSELGDVDDGKGLERHAPLLLHAELLADVLLGLEVAESSPVVGRIGRHRSNDSSSLSHRNGGHGQGINLLILGERGAQGLADKVSSLQLGEARVLAELLGHLLEGEVTGRSLTAHEVLAAGHLVHSVLALGQHIAVSLSVHGLRSQSSGHEEHVLSSQLGDHLGQLEELNLDTNVLLGANALTLCAVVISARLLVELGIDSVLLAVVDVSLALEQLELPADEAVEVGVLAGGDHGSTPVSRHADQLKILLALRREELQPLLGVLELRDFSLRDADLHEDLILSGRHFDDLGGLLLLLVASLGLALLLSGLLFLLLLGLDGSSRLLRSGLSLEDLRLESVGSGLDGHTRAVEAEREESAPALLPLVTSSELGLRHGEGVAQVEVPVHVREGECDHKLAVVLLLDSHIVVGLGGVDVGEVGGVGRPVLLHGDLDLSESVVSNS
mmetsp:Transcript_6261/g.10189  ORF Transcript_6261/g.10189 Transcript_6261/m.10189 type:complete len:687 (-) Transcript_6261:112-2172(-)